MFSGVSISATRFSTLKLVLIFNNRNTLHLNGAFQSAFQILNNLRIVFFHFYGMSSLEDLAAVQDRNVLGLSAGHACHATTEDEDTEIGNI